MASLRFGSLMPLKKRGIFRFFVSLLLALSSCLPSPNHAHAQWTAMNPVRDVQRQAGGVFFSLGPAPLKVQVCSDSVIRVLYSPAASFPKRADYVVIQETWPAAQWSMQSTVD